MINRIRAAFFKNALQKMLADNKRQRKTHTIASARHIGLLFDATADHARKDAIEQAKKLEQEGKKVELLGFIDDKQAPEPAPGFNFFLAKEASWAGIPKSEKVHAFSQMAFDLLLCFNPDALPALSWVAASANAPMKIGLATDQPHDFDMQLQTPREMGFRFFMDQLRIYLDKIVLTKP